MANRPTQQTRSRLIEAGLDLFGRFGFEGAGTRAIADAAGVNLAAIKYHFGSKEGLYNAVAEYIAGQIAAHMGEAGNRLQQELSSAPLHPDSARRAITLLLEGLTALLVSNPATEGWARFIVREQMSPSPAFDILYERGMSQNIALLSRLVAVVYRLPQGGAQARLSALILIGQVLVFRVARAAVMRAMGWQEIGAGERAEIEAAIRISLARLGPVPAGAGQDGTEQSGRKQ